MNKDEIRDKLVEIFINIYSSDNIYLIGSLMEGENSVLRYLFYTEDTVLPTIISKELNLTRARVTAILSSLRSKELIVMTMSDVDRRKMNVSLTKKGNLFIKRRIQFAEEVYDKIYNEMGERRLNQLIDEVEIVTTIIERNVFNYDSKKNKID